MPDADALSSYGYPPGESHLPHMAGHIWARTGDYARLAADNLRAVRNDEAWFAQGDGPGQQYMRRYHDHCVDFVLYGLTTLGRDDEARAAAKNEDAAMRVELALRLHDDAAVLATAAPSAHGERALAAARARRRWPPARAERAKAADGARGPGRPGAGRRGAGAPGRQPGPGGRGLRARLRRGQVRLHRRPQELLVRRRSARATARRCWPTSSRPKPRPSSRPS